MIQVITIATFLRDFRLYRIQLITIAIFLRDFRICTG